MSQAVKPASSRSQSAEIFVVGRNYKAPDFIDSRMLEPKHAFRQDYEVEGGVDCLESSLSSPKTLQRSIVVTKPVPFNHVVLCFTL